MVSDVSTDVFDAIQDLYKKVYAPKWLYQGTFPTGTAEQEEKVEKPLSHYPHRCPKCGTAAYIGLSTIEHYLAELDKTCR